MNQIWYWKTYSGWYTVKPNQTLEQHSQSSPEKWTTCWFCYHYMIGLATTFLILLWNCSRTILLSVMRILLTNQKSWNLHASQVCLTGFSLSMRPIYFNMWLQEWLCFFTRISCMQDMCTAALLHEVNYFSSYHHTDNWTKRREN